MSLPSPHSTHRAVQAGGGVLGGAAFPEKFLGGVVELGEDGVREAGVPPCHLKQEPGVEPRGHASFHQGYCSERDGGCFWPLCAAPAAAWWHKVP